MLPKGSIAKIYEYYYSTPRYRDEMLRATREFFDRPDLDRGGTLEMNEKSESLFNEWFLYDFKLSNGKITLADFIAENPLRLTPVEMIIYKDLLKTNTYGLYEVISININNGLIVKDLWTGRKFYTREQKLTFQVNPHNVFFERIGKVGDHYEFIGADPFLINNFGESERKLLKKINFELTPKIAHEIWKRYNFA